MTGDVAGCAAAESGTDDGPRYNLFGNVAHRPANGFGNGVEI